MYLEWGDNKIKQQRQHRTAEFRLQDTSAKWFTRWLHSLRISRLFDEPTDWLTKLVTDSGCALKTEQAVSAD